MLKNKTLIFSAVFLAFASSHASAASVVGTSWNLSGKFTGKISAKCEKGGGSAPFAKPGPLSATISFNDGSVMGDNEGRFIWADSQFSPRQAQGNWTQNGNKLELEFDNWYDSPLATFGMAMGLAGSFDYSQDGVTGSYHGYQPTKLGVTANVAGNGKKLALAETMGFKFDASGSAHGYSNSCNFSFNFGRVYKGTPAP